MTLEQLLSSKNIDGEIYLCDVMRFFNIISHDQARDLRAKLQELRNKLK